MRTLYLIFLSSFISGYIMAQKMERQDNYPTYSLSLISERVAVSYDFGSLPDSTSMATYVDEVFPADRYGNILQTARRKTLSAHHYDFQQFISDVPVYKSFLNLSITSTGKLMAQSQGLVDLYKRSISTGEFGAKQAASYLRNIGSSGEVEGITIGPVYFPADGELVPATAFRYYSGNQAIGTFEVVVDENGTVLYEQDLRVNLKLASDTIINVKVFNPDPITTAQTVYSDTTLFSDNNDSTNVALEAQQFVRTVEAEYDNGVFRLKNRHFELAELSAPAKPFCTSATPDFFYTRDEDCFEQINALYHISSFHLYVESLGFTNLKDSSIRVDVHALSGNENSQYNPDINALLFGEGGVDDAEDADVIIHEYAHAISEWQKPKHNSDNSMAASDRKALDEAFGDYLASSYSKSLSLYNYRKLYNWDGPGVDGLWSGRSTLSNKTYDDRRGFSIYSDGIIWSAAMMTLNDQLGREYMDQLLIETHAFYFAGMTMKDAAQLLLTVNVNLNNSAHENIIAKELSERKLIDSPKEVILVKGGFIKPDNSVSVLFPGNWLNANIRFGVYSSHGQLIHEAETVAGVSAHALRLPQLARGVYIVRVTGPDGNRSFKVIKQ